MAKTVKLSDSLHISVKLYAFKNGLTVTDVVEKILSKAKSVGFGTVLGSVKGEDATIVVTQLPPVSGISDTDTHVPHQYYPDTHNNEDDYEAILKRASANNVLETMRGVVVDDE